MYKLLAPVKPYLIMVLICIQIWGETKIEKFIIGHIIPNKENMLSSN